MFFGVLEQRITIGVKWRAVIKQQRCFGGECRHQPVPHHPAAGGEIENLIVAADIAVEFVFFQMLQQRTTRAMHDAFRDACRAGRKHDIKRRIEFKTLERDFLRFILVAEFGERHGVQNA